MTNEPTIRTLPDGRWEIHCPGCGLREAWSPVGMSLHTASGALKAIQKQHEHCDKENPE